MGCFFEDPEFEDRYAEADDTYHALTPAEPEKPTEAEKAAEPEKAAVSD